MEKRIKTFISKARAKIKGRIEGEKQTFLWRIIKTLPVVIVALLFIFYFSRSELYTKLQTSFLDTQMRLDNPSDESDIVIVEITQADFDNFFEGKTHPLNPPKLQKLITAVSSGNPCVIAVDIGTDFPEFADREIFQVGKNWSPIVWVRDIKIPGVEVSEKPIPAEILGGRTDTVKNSGLPLLIDDSSGITRKYKRLLDTEKGELPSFAWAIFRQAARQKCVGIKFPTETEIEKRQKDNASLLIKYSRGNSIQVSEQNSAGKGWNEAEYIGRTRIPASQILALAETDDWQNNELIKNKIVLLGGSYGEDVHETPLGKMLGVEIIANVIETELAGGGIEPPGFLTMALLAVFDGFLMLGFFHIFSWHRAFILSTAALFVLSFACSFLTFYSFSYWVLFAPVMFGVLLTELIDRSKDYFKDYYKTKLKEGYEQVKTQKPNKENSSSEEKDL